MKKRNGKPDRISKKRGFLWRQIKDPCLRGDFESRDEKISCEAALRL